MIEFLQLVAAGFLIEHSVRVEGERFLRSIDSDRNRTALVESNLQGVLIVRCDVHVSCDRSDECCVLHVTISILTQVIPIAA